MVVVLEWRRGVSVGARDYSLDELDTGLAPAHPISIWLGSMGPRMLLRPELRHRQIAQPVVPDNVGQCLAVGVGYLDSSGIYNDGYRTKDSFNLKPGNASSGPCFPSICIATYGYDPRDRLVHRDDGRGSITTYNLDPSATF